MRQNSLIIIFLIFVFCSISTEIFSQETASHSATGSSPSEIQVLIKIMQDKGILTSTEAQSLQKSSPQTQMESLVSALVHKGVLSSADVMALKTNGSPSTQTPAIQSKAVVETAKTPVPAQIATPTVVAAIMPLRMLPIDPPQKEGLIPDLKIGAVRVKPYGMIKASAIYDTSSPRGDDMPINFFMFGDSGPDKSPEFHLKARFLRLGSNFEWPDFSKNLTITGKFEFDFEGNFTKTDNRNVSSVRSSQASIRQAWGRLDYTFNPKNALFFLAGQDWTPFGSSTLPNLVETTGLGLGFGTLYQRAPLMRFGLIHNFGGARRWKVSPEFALVLPGYGNTPSLIQDQLSIGERQGADSGRPDLSGRFVTQFQLDKTPAIAPAQLIFSWVQGRRESIVKAADVPTAYKGAFPTGARVGNDRWGVSGEFQLPTRYATLLGKWYTGADLRWYFVGELFSHFNKTSALTNILTAPSIDGSDTVVFGLRNGVPTLAPQHGMRTAGGFVNLGFPLSRIFHVNPVGRMSGWSMYLHYSVDQAKAGDVRQCSSGNGSRWKSDLIAGNLQWKLTPLVTLAIEESQYRTFALPGANGVYPLYRGVPSSVAKDLRTEFSTIFAF